MVEDAVPGGGLVPGFAGSQPFRLTNVDGTLYFAADTAGAGGRELWRITSSGIAELVEDSIPLNGIRVLGGSLPDNLTNVNGTLYFSADDGRNGVELWRVNALGVAEIVDDGIPSGRYQSRGSIRFLAE